MTRKTCTDHPHVDILLQSLCRELYHFDNCYFRRCKTAAQHKLLGNHNPLGFNGLCRFDSIIKLFFKTNGLTLNNNQLESIKLSLQQLIAPMTRNKMPRTRTTSMGYKVKHSPLSPMGSDFGHRLRTRRHTSFVNSYVDTSGDDDSNHIRPMRELRSTSKLLAKASEPEPDTWESGRPKRACIKQKRISADEQLVVDNKNYYKVEVMTNKLRSSGVPFREFEIPVLKKIRPLFISEDSEEDKGPIVKARKSRNTELTRLNSEAENFLFPHKDESSSEEDTDVDTSPTRLNNKKDVLLNNSRSKSNKISKNEPEEESSMDSTSSETSVVRKKRRLTQAEAFILDNQKYYKFETPGSRLRYQGSYLAPIPPKNNGEYGAKQAKNKEIVEEDTAEKLKLEELAFSFEVVPKNEPWYKTFQRQDVGDECYTCYDSASGYYEPFLLPYEMGPLPPLDPRLCVYAYNQMKKRFLGETIPSTSAACSTPDSCSADTTTGKTDYHSSTGDDTKSSEDSTMESDFAETYFRKSKVITKSNRGRRRRVFLTGRNPRKSPRQHASTLAILSSLIHQRKRREVHRTRGSDYNLSKHNLSAITEEVQEPEPDYEAVAKNINDMLSNSEEQLSALELSMSDDGVNVDVHYKPDIIETLDDYVNCKDGLVVVTNKTQVTSDVVRKPGRKKKKNRTGWPNKNNRRTVFRKEGSDSRDGLGGSSEQENSIIDSPSVDVDSEINEENSEDNNCNKRSKNVSLSKLTTFIENTISSNNTSGASKINGNVQANKLNGVTDNFELNFKSFGTPRRKEHRESSSENCAEVVIASVGDKIDCVNVDLAKWETAERVLAAKLRSEAINNDIQFQPIVRVQKLDSDLTVRRTEKQVPMSPSPRRTRPRRMPASPKSPRMLRRPRGGWYRERY